MKAKKLLLAAPVAAVLFLVVAVLVVTGESPVDYTLVYEGEGPERALVVYRNPAEEGKSLGFTLVWTDGTAIGPVIDPICDGEPLTCSYNLGGDGQLAEIRPQETVDAIHSMTPWGDWDMDGKWHRKVTLQAFDVSGPEPPLVISTTQVISGWQTLTDTVQLERNLYAWCHQNLYEVLDLHWHGRGLRSVVFGPGLTPSQVRDLAGAVNAARTGYVDGGGLIWQTWRDGYTHGHLFDQWEVFFWNTYALYEPIIVRSNPVPEVTPPGIIIVPTPSP